MQYLILVITASEDVPAISIHSSDHYGNIIMKAMVSNHRRLDCLLNHLFWRRSEKTPKLRVTDLCEGNSPVTSEFPTKRASNLKNASIHATDSDIFPT